MNMLLGEALVGSVMVQTTSGRGASPEEFAERALRRIIYIGEHVPPEIRAQAEGYREHIRDVLLFYLREAVSAHNRTLAIKLTEAGHPELISLLED